MTASYTQGYRPDQWLQQATDLAMSALLARLDLDMGARPYFWVDLKEAPPRACHAYWDYNDIAGRFVDALVLARAITGRQDATAEENLLREFLWAAQDPVDGLFYNPVEPGGPGIEIDKYRPSARAGGCDRHVDLFCQRAPLLAMATLTAAGEEYVSPRLQAMVRGLSAISRREGDVICFPTYRWARTLRPEWYSPTSAPERWVAYRYALLTGLARYVELSADPEATALATGLARFYMRHGDVPPDGRFRGNTHSGGILPATVGIARLGLALGDRDMIEWADRVYRYVRERTPDFGFIVDALGLDGVFAGTCETCALADLLHLAIVLSEAKVGDYWDDVERFARNQLLENQYRDAAMLRQALPGIADRVLAMLLGSFECAAHPNSLLTWNGVEACCIGGGIRALYLVWRAAIVETGQESRVHLGFSRSTPHVEVIAHEPWAGRLEVYVRSPRRLLVRMPWYVLPGEISTHIDGTVVSAARRGSYVVFEPLQPGQHVVIEYPLHQRTRSYEIAGRSYSARWLGNTVIEIEPAGERYPIYRRRDLIQPARPCPGAMPEPVPHSAVPAPRLW